jgi:hypothetical protein
LNVAAVGDLEHVQRHPQVWHHTAGPPGSYARPPRMCASH